MTDESSASGPHGPSGGTARERLDKAARLRAEAAQILAMAERIEAREAKERKENDTRDSRIVGGVLMKLAQGDVGLARTILNGLGVGSISIHDRKHLSREDGALAQLRRIVDSKPPLVLSEPQDTATSATDEQTSVRAPDGAWFSVAFADKNRVPAGVRYDPETKMRFAPTRVLVEEMRALGFEERHDLAGQPFPERQ